jgi:uncharacterized alkaline shock family protein YloU
VIVAVATGSVIVAPHVLVRLVSLALREVSGVARLGGVPRARAGLRGGKSSAGVVAQVGLDGVSIDCYLIAEAGANMLDLGIAVQATVAAVIQELAGMSVREVNVYIQDVEASSG